MVFTVLLIFFLIVANGILSAAEIAIISVRKSRMAQLASAGATGASTVIALKEDPNKFLATVQVGITFVGALAAAIGGQSSGDTLEPYLRIVAPFLGAYTRPVSLAIVVAIVSFLSLVIGELVPKTLALRHSERLACWLAPPVLWLARVTQPAVRILNLSSGLILWMFRSDGRPEETFVSEEEVKHIVHEGAQQGIFDEAERALIHSVFEFTDTSVREVMVPRADIHALEVETTAKEALESLLDTGFSRTPVYDNDLDHIVGVIHVKDLLRATSTDPTVSLRAIAHAAHFVPDSMQISDLLRELQLRRTHLAVVLNEFGTVVGLVTIEDLLEEIVGEIRDEFDTDEEQAVQTLADGSLLVEGSVLLDDLRMRHQLPLEETEDYKTIAGLILARLKRIPKGGEVVTHGALRMTVVATDRRRVRKVRIERAKAAA